MSAARVNRSLRYLGEQPVCILSKLKMPKVRKGHSRWLESKPLIVALMYTVSYKC